MVATVAAGQTDAAVIEASWQAPDQFGLLHDRHVAALYRYACQRVGPAAAEDVVAETFLHAFAGRRGYDLAYENARPWLFGILTRRIARWARTEQRHYQAMARSAPEAVSDGIEDRVAERVTAQLSRGVLATALARLNRADRDVLLLISWGQLSYDEAAHALGIPLGTVASRMNRARRKLREALANGGDE